MRSTEVKIFWRPPMRYVIVLLATIACGLVYVLRLNISAAIVDMVYQASNTASQNTSQASDQLLHGPTHAPIHSPPKFDWSSEVQGFVLSSYFLGYAATQVLGGRTAERFDSVTICGLGLGVSSILTLLIPIAAMMDAWMLVIVRVVIGTFHGLTYASVYVIFSKWIPKEEISTALALVTVGSYVGAGVAMELSGFICGKPWTGGWPTVFYLTGAASLIWLLFWFAFATRTPELNSFISLEELAYIQNSLNRHGDDDELKSIPIGGHGDTKSIRTINIGIFSEEKSLPQVKDDDERHDMVGGQAKCGQAPWAAIFTSGPVWGATVGKATSGFGVMVLTVELPIYLETVIGMSIERNCRVNAIAQVAMCLSMVMAGPASDMMRRHTGFHLTTIRKIFQTIAMIGPAACLIAIAFTPYTSETEIIVLLLLAVFFYGFSTGGEIPIFADLSANYSGTVFGCANTVCCLGQFTAALLVGYMLHDSPHASGAKHTEDLSARWSSLFLISAGLKIVGSIVFNLFASAKVQPWAIDNASNSTRSSSPSSLQSVPLSISFPDRKSSLLSPTNIAILASPTTTPTITLAPSDQPTANVAGDLNATILIIPMGHESQVNHHHNHHRFNEQGSAADRRLQVDCLGPNCNSDCCYIATESQMLCSCSSSTLSSCSCSPASSQSSTLSTPLSSRRSSTEANSDQFNESRRWQD